MHQPICSDVILTCDTDNGCSVSGESYDEYRLSVPGGSMHGLAPGPHKAKK